MTGTVTKPETTKPEKVYTNQAVLYDPDREPLAPISGKRSVRTFTCAYPLGSVTHDYGSYSQTLTTTGNVEFKPGINFIEAEKWDNVKELHGVKARLGCGSLRVLVPLKDGEISDTSAFSEEDARLMIANCWATEELENWARYERRVELRQLITERIRKINSGEIK